MSSDKPPVNPYAASERGYVPEYIEQGPPRQSTGAFSFVAIVCMILGGLGLVVILIGAVSMLLGLDRMAMQMNGGAPGMPQDIVAIQQDMMDKASSINQRYKPINILILSIHSLVAVGLLYGGIRAIQRDRKGVALLAMVCAAAIGFEMIRMCVTLIVQMEMSQVVLDFQEKIFAEQMKTAPPGAQPAMKAIQGMAATFQGIAMCMGVGFVLIKVAFYIFAFLHLRKPQTQALLR